MGASAVHAAWAVRMTGISKRFGAVAANDDVNLSVRVGTVHGIVGENGAGKSTLMSVLYGFYQADAGRIEVLGREAHAFDPNGVNDHYLRTKAMRFGHMF